MKNYVIYHKNCNDGFTAAWAAWLHFGDRAEYIGASYGSKPPKVEKGSMVFLVDVSFPREDLEALADNAERVTILDHHKTAYEDLKDLKHPLEISNDKLRAIFDMEKSGARIAWEFFHPESEVPLLVKLVEDRDLWKFEHGDMARQLHAYLASMDMTFHEWAATEEFLRERPKLVLEEGQAILDYKSKVVEKLLKHAWFGEYEGKKYAIANATSDASETCHALLMNNNKIDFAMTFSFLSDGQIQYSLRSRNSQNVDVSQIAKQYGGGGHKHASGIRTKKRLFGVGG